VSGSIRRQSPVERLRADQTAAFTQAELAESNTEAETSGRGILTCCTPLNTPWPSGWHLSHSRHCRMSPGQKVRESDYPDFIPLPEPVSHPAGADLPVGGIRSARIARRHAPECGCRHCAYASFWMDDEATV